MTEIQNSKQKQMNPNGKKYDLEERTFEFARDVRRFVKKLTKTLANVEDGRQLIRSSGSIGANYIEANESLSKKDFLMRIKISRKEAKESRFWLRLLDVQVELEKEHNYLLNESVEITNIFGAILRKTEG